MNNPEFIEIVNKYQNNNYVHSFTCECGAGSLEPFEKDNNVKLRCKTCGWEQNLSGLMVSMVFDMYDYNPFPGVEIKK